MKIAVTHDKGTVFQHFGQSTEFKVYTTEGETVLSSEVKAVEGEGHGALAGLLQSWGVTAVICGGMGEGAKNALTEAGIDIYGGVTGETDQQVDAFLRGELAYNPNVECGHHGEGHDHHKEGHDHDHHKKDHHNH